MQFTILEKLEAPRDRYEAPTVECPGCGRRYRRNDVLRRCDCPVCLGEEEEARRSVAELEEAIAHGDYPTVRRLLNELEGDTMRLLCYARLDQLAAAGVDTKAEVI